MKSEYWTKTLLSTAIAASLVVGGNLAAQEKAAEPPQIAPGQQIPEFDAEGLDGEMKHVSFAGHHTVIVFFLSSCSVCHKMIPEWNQAFERKPEGLQVIGVILDREPPGFFMTMPVSFPVVRAPTRDFAANLGIRRVPSTVRVDEEGVVQNAAKGILDPIALGEYFRP